MPVTVRPAPFSRGDVARVVEAATRAPSILNCQPWRFEAHDDVIDVSVVTHRTPERLDPAGREVCLSLGAAVFNLRLAVLAAGRTPVVQLLPDPYNRLLAARIRITGTGELSPSEAALFRAIPLTGSSRMPFTEVSVPIEEFLHLQDDAAREGCHLQAATGSFRGAVVEASREAERVQITDPAQCPVATFETSALLAVLMTTGDEPINWIRGGMALERVLLSATARGLSVGLLAQSGEFPDLRLMLRDPFSPWHHSQIALRFGYATPMPPPAAIPLRRPVTDVLVMR